MAQPPATLNRFARDCGLELEPFQRRITSALQGAQPELVVLLPRGNGKTSLLACLALHSLLTTPDAEVYCAAASREQARSCSRRPPSTPATSTTRTSSSAI